MSEVIDKVTKEQLSGVSRDKLATPWELAGDRCLLNPYGYHEVKPDIADGCIYCGALKSMLTQHPSGLIWKRT